MVWITSDDGARRRRVGAPATSVKVRHRQRLRLFNRLPVCAHDSIIARPRCACQRLLLLLRW